MMRFSSIFFTLLFFFCRVWCHFIFSKFHLFYITTTINPKKKREKILLKLNREVEREEKKRSEKKNFPYHICHQQITINIKTNKHTLEKKESKLFRHFFSINVLIINQKHNTEKIFP